MEALRAISVLRGGLGNQLFQLAFNDYFCSLVPASGVVLSQNFDEVDSFQRSVDQDLVEALGLLQTKTFDAASAGIISDSILNFIVERSNIDSAAGGGGAIIDPIKLKVNDFILDGYFQDRRIIRESFKKKLREYLRRILPKSDQEEKMLAKLQGKYCVSVHIRRSDYFHHGVTDLNYFIDYMEAFKMAAPESEFLIFSDEPNCVLWILKNHFIEKDSSKWSNALHFFDATNLKFEFRLMSACPAHIISNSTLSYWAALISDSDYVIYPTPWSFAHHPSNYLIPSSWREVSGVVNTFVRRKTDVELDFGS